MPATIGHHCCLRRTSSRGSICFPPLTRALNPRQRPSAGQQGHSGKTGLGRGLLLGRLATGFEPGVSSLHVFMDSRQGASSRHPRGDANGIPVQLPPIGNPGRGAEGNPPDLVGRLDTLLPWSGSPGPHPMKSRNAFGDLLWHT